MIVNPPPVAGDVSGTRVHTDIDDGDLYVAIPGANLVRIAEETHTISARMINCSAYHQDRRLKFTAG